MAENRHTKQLHAQALRADRDVQEWRLIVYSGGAVTLDKTVRSKKAAQVIWNKYREGDCWVECYADGRKLRWIEAERSLMGYVHCRMKKGGDGRDL